VSGVAFAPNGRTLATGSIDQTVRLWDVSDRDRPRQLGQPLTGHTSAVSGVAFAPNGRTLVTASGDQTVTLWDLPRPDRFAGGEVREACTRAGGPLDKATWDQYAPTSATRTPAQAVDPAAPRTVFWRTLLRDVIEDAALTR
jgi:WD40 repeat protein